MNEQLVQVLGSILVLIPFALTQLGRVDPGSPGYLGFNLAGSGILAVDAALTRQWGFLLLEGTWAAVSLYGLLSRRASPRRRRAARSRS